MGSFRHFRGSDIDVMEAYYLLHLHNIMNVAQIL